jgi:hypothetical protein
MKNYFLLLLALISICTGKIIAQRQIHYGEAIAVARNMLNYLDYDNNSISDIAAVRVHVFQESDTKIDTLLYEMELTNGAEILLSGNRACKPVLAHGYSGSIFRTDEDLPCGMQFFLDSYIEQIEFAFTFTDTLSYVAEWEELKIFDETQVDVKGAVVVAPLLSTHWGQSLENCCMEDSCDREAYNHYVNHIYNGVRCKVGCVAVAMGQIMNFHKYPVCVSQLGKKQFDWCNMADRLCHTDDGYDEKKLAVSWLLYQCRQSVDAKCNSDASSSASMTDARNALVDVFSFDNEADYQIERFHNTNVWKGRIQYNLNQGWPVLYGGNYLCSLRICGHAFVCDGYNNNGEYHFNFGWRGDHDNQYFSLHAIAPQGNNYSLWSDAIFYIHPPEPNPNNYCNYTMNLENFYIDYYQHITSMFPFPSQIPPLLLPPAHLVTPKNFTTLVSAAETSDSTWHIIPDTANTEYVAHKEVILRSGFKVKRGAEFTARIVPCPNCDYQLSPQLRGNSIIDTAIETQKMAAEKGSLAVNDLTLYPNPATQILTIMGIDELADMHIYDNRGSEIRCWKFVGYSDSELKINVVQLPVGTYIIRVGQRNGKILVGKFVKK